MSTPEALPTTEAIEPELVIAPQPVIERNVPLWRLVLWLAVPVWLQQMLHLVVTLSDAALAGRFLEMTGAGNVTGQAAQTTAHYLYWFLSCYSILVAAGSTALVARCVGGKDYKTAIRATDQSMILGLIFGISAAICGWMLIDTFVWLLQLEGETATSAAEYLEPMFFSLPFLMLEAIGIACLIGAGDTISGTIIMAVVAVLNVPISWGLALGLWGLPQMGFVGISAGTAISHVLGCLAVLLLLLRGRAGLSVNPARWLPDFSLMYRILRVGVPAGVDSLSLIIGQFWFLSIVNQLGEVASAAHGIAVRWEALGYLSGYAFMVASTSLVGQHLGANDPARAARSGWTSFNMGCGLMIVMGIICLIFAEPMFAFFCPRPEQRPIVELGVPLLRLVAFAMPCIASTMIFGGALRGAGDTRVPVLYTWTGFLLIRIPLAYFLTGPMEMGLFGAWIAMIIDLFVRGCFLMGRFYWGKWKMVRV